MGAGHIRTSACHGLRFQVPRRNTDVQHKPYHLHSLGRVSHSYQGMVRTIPIVRFPDAIHEQTLQAAFLRQQSWACYANPCCTVFHRTHCHISIHITQGATARMPCFMGNAWEGAGISSWHLCVQATTKGHAIGKDSGRIPGYRHRERENDPREHRARQKFPFQSQRGRGRSTREWPRQAKECRGQPCQVLSP